MDKAIHRRSKQRVNRRKNPPDQDKATRAPSELSSHRLGLNSKVKNYGLESKELVLSWEEIEDIPCITDMKCGEYILVDNQYILKERTE